MREKRTVSVDFGLSISEYRRVQADGASFIECVTATMRVVTHVKHAGAGRHRYTRHSTRPRPLHCQGSGFTQIPVSQIRCLDCHAVFTVLPSFVLRYQRFEVRLAAVDAGARFDSSFPRGNAWGLRRRLGQSVPVSRRDRSLRDGDRIFRAGGEWEFDARLNSWIRVR